MSYVIESRADILHVSMTSLTQVLTSARRRCRGCSAAATLAERTSTFEMCSSAKQTRDEMLWTTSSSSQHMPSPPSYDAASRRSEVSLGVMPTRRECHFMLQCHAGSEKEACTWLQLRHPHHLTWLAGLVRPRGGRSGADSEAGPGWQSLANVAVPGMPCSASTRLRHPGCPPSGTAVVGCEVVHRAGRTAWCPLCPVTLVR